MPLRVLKAHQSGKRRRSMKKSGEKKRKMGPEAVDPPIQSCGKIRRRPRRWSRARNTGMASATGINTQEQLEPSNLLFYFLLLFTGAHRFPPPHPPASYQWYIFWDCVCVCMYVDSIDVWICVRWPFFLARRSSPSSPLELIRLIFDSSIAFPPLRRSIQAPSTAAGTSIFWVSLKWFFASKGMWLAASPTRQDFVQCNWDSDGSS